MAEGMSTSRGSEWPPLAELLPHAGPMRLLERVEAHDGKFTACRADPSASALFRTASGAIPAWVGIEYMAQCAATHGGLLARARGEPPRPGLFVGSRRLVFRCESFAPEVPLVVTSRLAAGRVDTLAFDCTVEDPAGGAPLAEGRLNVRLLRGLPVPGDASA
jgi:predicted hotdog family 3-hydroxylacyl-ACP dehydratase